MLKPEFSGQFKKDYKLALKRGCDPKKLERVITLLCQEEQLPASYRDHALVNSRNYKNVRECHIQLPTWPPAATLSRITGPSARSMSA
ncbi:MAG: type II toxin-antitoxin system YafQ family toxin [Clostridiales bacterium]|nr:type II toxin-antitoxin system YafQ family toxin [Clostridiales bacterium]